MVISEFFDSVAIISSLSRHLTLYVIVVALLGQVNKALLYPRLVKQAQKSIMVLVKDVIGVYFLHLFEK